MSWWSEAFFRLPQPWSFPSRRPGNHPPHSGLWPAVPTVPISSACDILNASSTVAAFALLQECDDYEVHLRDNPSYLVRSWGKGPTQPPCQTDGHCPGKKLVVFGRLHSACFSCWRSHHQISTPAADISLNRPRLNICIPRSENQHGQEGRCLFSKKKNVRMMVWFRWCSSSSRPVFSGSMLIFQGVLKL